MTGKYFIDTNILVYAHDTDSPDKQKKAQDLIFSSMRERIGSRVIGTGLSWQQPNAPTAAPCFPKISITVKHTGGSNA